MSCYIVPGCIIQSYIKWFTAIAVASGLFFWCVGFFELLDFGGIVVEYDLDITQTREVAQQSYA